MTNTTRKTDLQAAVDALAANPTDAAAMAALKRLATANTVAVAGAGLTNDQIKLQQGSGAYIANRTAPGGADAYAGIILPEGAGNMYQNLQDAAGKVADLSGVVPVNVEFAQPMADYAQAIADANVEASTVVPANVIETTVGTVHTLTDQGEVPAGPLTTSAIASAVDAPEADEQTLAKSKKAK